MCRMTGFSPRIFKGAGHEWGLRLRRHAVFYLPIRGVSLPARATTSLQNRLLAPSSRSRSHRSLYSYQHKANAVPDTLPILGAGMNTNEGKVPDTPLEGKKW